MTDNSNGWSCRRVVMASILVMLGIVGFVLIVHLSTVFIPVGIALLIAYILEPVITFMDHHRSRRVFTVLLVYILFLALISGFGFWVGPPLIDQGRDFVSFVQEKSEEYGITEEMLDSGKKAGDQSENESEGWWAGLFSDDDETKDYETDDSGSSPSGGKNGANQKTNGHIGLMLQRHAATVGEKLPMVAMVGMQAILTGAGNVATFVIQFVLTLFYAFFFMLHFPAILNTIDGWIPRARKREAHKVLHEIDDVVAGFFRGRLLVCVISSAVMSLGLWISGVDYWLLLGIAAGFLGIIPFIGVTMTLIPALLIAFTSDPILFQVVGVLVTFGIVQALVEPFVGPFVISSRVRMHPVTVTVAFMAGGALLGVSGLLLAIPTCGILRILGRRYLAPAAKNVIRG